MKGERIEQRELGWDRHDAQVERMESNGKTVGWETRSSSPPRICACLLAPPLTWAGG